MPKIRQPTERGYPQNMGRPAFGQGLLAAPASPVCVLLLVEPLEDSIGALPGPRIQCRPPHGLRLGPVDREATKALELAPVAAVDQGVVGKALTGEHAEPGTQRGGARARIFRGADLLARHGASAPSRYFAATGAGSAISSSLSMASASASRL